MTNISDEIQREIIFDLSFQFLVSDCFELLVTLRTKLSLNNYIVNTQSAYWTTQVFLLEFFFLNCRLKVINQTLLTNFMLIKAS